MLPAEVPSALVRTGLSTEPALQGLAYVFEPIPCGRYNGCPLGLYNSDIRTITLPPVYLEGVLFHEWGHAFGDFYYGDLSEEYAEWFRRSLGGGKLVALAALPADEFHRLASFEAIFQPGERGAVEIGLSSASPEELEAFRRGLPAGARFSSGPDFVRVEFTKTTVPFLPFIFPLGAVFLASMIGFGVFKVEEAVAKNIVPIALIAGGSLLVYGLANSWIRTRA